MVKLILIFTTLFSVQAMSGFYYPVGKGGINSGSSSIEMCKEKSGQDCYDISGKNLEYWELKDTQVDDLSKPLYKTRYKLTTCSDELDCSEKLGKLDDPSTYCDGDDSISTSKNSGGLPGWSFYCTSIIGYEKKTEKKLVLNEEKKAAYEAKAKKEQEDAENRAAVAAAMSFGTSIKVEMNLVNAKKNLTAQQIQDYVDQFAGITRLLDAGAISAARSRIALIEAGTSVTAEEKAYILKKMDDFLAGSK